MQQNAGEHPQRNYYISFIEITLRHWVFSSKFAAYFQNTFSLAHIWKTAFFTHKYF